MLKSKTKRVDISLRAPQKRKNFFEKREKAESKVFLKIITRLLFFVFAGICCYVLFFSPFLEISQVVVEGNTELDAEELSQSVWQNFGGKYFQLIPRNNLIISFPESIKANLLNSYKKISGAEVTRVFPDEIKVKITERKALLIWCSAGPCYIIDENGYAYTGADFESEEIKQNHLINLIDGSAKPVIMGEKVLSPDYIQFVSGLKDKLDSQLGIKITEEYQTDSRIAEEAKVKTEDGWEIFFSSTLPIDESLKTLQTFLDKEMADKDRSKLEYIDLRAENKVYYKFKDGDEQNNGEEVQNSSETQQPVQQEDKKDDKKKKKG